MYQESLCFYCLFLYRFLCKCQIRKFRSHILKRKGVLRKSLEHCLRNRLRSVYLADPTFMYESSKSQKFLSLVNFSGARSCRIFDDLLIPKFHLIWKRFLENIFWKIVFKSLFTFCVEKEFWSKKNFGKDFYIAKIKRKVFFIRYLNCVQFVFLKDFIF